ncbi:hypothetical protein [Proteiniphilum propionicum]|uniref:hypothetical protein n=1 Tax=Proteiniphilum propionicum TaxID=2829812 RepID=UPI001EEB8DC3|nr:hypothetical protein [Proteiniphilum propionicum]ULB35923.1 hypothetical protein KDN43_07900 [Proteiniphilum propionicum]
MKQNKIIVAVHPDAQERRRIIQGIMIRLGFALTQNDAGKFIKPLVHDFDLQQCYFVCAELHNFSESPITNQRLYELAARGLAVVVGTKRLPAQYEIICQAVYD